MKNQIYSTGYSFGANCFIQAFRQNWVVHGSCPTHTRHASKTTAAAANAKRILRILESSKQPVDCFFFGALVLRSRRLCEAAKRKTTKRHSRKFMQSIETPEKKEEDCAHSKRSNYVNLYVLQEKRERGVMLASMFFNERDRERERDRFSTFVNIIMCKLPENMSQKTPISSGNLRLGLMVKYRQWRIFYKKVICQVKVSC